VGTCRNTNASELGTGDGIAGKGVAITIYAIPCLLNLDPSSIATDGVVLDRNIITTIYLDGCLT